MMHTKTVLTLALNVALFTNTSAFSPGLDSRIISPKIQRKSGSSFFTRHEIIASRKISTKLYFGPKQNETNLDKARVDASSGSGYDGDFTGDMPFFQEQDTDASQQLIQQTPASSGEGLLWRGVVVVLCALWASNFAAAKLVMGEPGVDSSLYAVSRFSVAALALIPGSIGAIKRGVIDWETAKGAAICGSWVSLGYLGQTLGLLTTTASRSCVICTLHCVFVAAVAEFMRVQRACEIEANSTECKSFDFIKLAPAAVAVAGVAIVELKGAGGAPSIGDLLSFAQPIGFVWGICNLRNWFEKSPKLDYQFQRSNSSW